MDGTEVIMSENPEKDNDKKFGKSFLKRAKGNLRSSKILFKEGEYADSVFLLQQCVEKSLKGYALYSGVLEKKDFEYRGRDYKSRDKNNYSIGRGHALFDIFKRMFSQRKLRLQRTKDNSQNEPELYKLLNITPEKIVDQQEDLENHLKQLYEIESSAKQWKMPDKDIRKYISDIKKLNASMEDLYNQYDAFWNKFQNNLGIKLVKVFMKVFQKITNADTSKIERDSPAIFNILGNSFRLSIQSMKIGGTLLHLSIMLKAHATKPRYPDIIFNFDPDDFYTPTLPLVKHLAEIQTSAEQCILDIESYISIAESKNN
jgi:hypothetical protein